MPLDEITIAGLREGQHRSGGYGTYKAGEEEHHVLLPGTVLTGKKHGEGEGHHDGRYLGGDASDPAEAAIPIQTVETGERIYCITS